MAVSTKNVDPAFQGIGQKAGMDIWRVEDFQPVPIPKSEYGKFYSGDSYVVLQTTALKSGGFHYDIHFWLGKDTSQDEAGVAAIKTVELDAALGGRAVQYREVQGHETDKFLSYFRPCIIPLEGGVASGFRKAEVEKYEPQLYVCKGQRVARVKQVPFVRSSLNHDDVFILDTEFKIYQFNGSTSSIQERAKALEVVQYIKDTYHEGKCEVAVIDDGKLEAVEDSGEFWVLFGGFAPIGRKGGNDDDYSVKSAPPKLYCIADGQPVPVGTSPLAKKLLDSSKCYLLDCGADLYVWVGRTTTLEERKAASSVAEELVSKKKISKSVHLTRIIQGFEPLPFRTQFEEWPLGTGAVSEDGRVKVAALLKQQGINVKGILKSASSEEIPPLLNANGKLEVWRIDGSKKTRLSSTELGRFYSGDCYIVLYTYPGERRDEFYLCLWIGKHSVGKEQASALRVAIQMANLLKGRPVQGRIMEGKEPAQFIGLFKHMLILKGGLSLGYREHISKEGIDDDTYKEDGMALIRVQGTGPHNRKAVQVDLDASLLNSSDCFILHTGATTVYLWIGNSSTPEEQQWAAKMAEYVKPGAVQKIVKEGSEPGTFWNPLGGKMSHPTQRLGAESGKDPRLFSCSSVNGKLQFSEVFHFTQDELLSEDVMVLDTFNEIFVWVGQHTDPGEKQQAFEIAQKYLEWAARLEGVSLDIPVFKVMEGNEPFFFTRHFSNWDPVKAAGQGDSFEKRLAVVLGRPIPSLEQTSKQNPKKHNFLSEGMDSDSDGKTSQISSKASYIPEHSGPTQRAAAMAALLASLTEEKKVVSSRNPFTKVHAVGTDDTASMNHVTDDDKSVVSGLSAPSETESVHSVEAADSAEPVNSVEATIGDPSMSNEMDVAEKSEVKDVADKSEVEEIESSKGYISYERLKVKSPDPISGIDITKRESYLSPEEFRVVFKMEAEQFYRLPKWKQDMHKRSANLF